MAKTEYATVTGDKLKTYCPLTRTMQIWDDTSGDFIDFNASTYTWGAATDQGSASDRMKFVVDTQAGTTLDN